MVWASIRVCKRERQKHSPVDGECVWHWRAHCFHVPICCYSMNRRTCLSKCRSFFSFTDGLFPFSLINFDLDFDSHLQHQSHHLAGELSAKLAIDAACCVPRSKFLGYSANGYFAFAHATHRRISWKLRAIR